MPTLLASIKEEFNSETVKKDVLRCIADWMISHRPEIKIEIFQGILVIDIPPVEPLMDLIATIQTSTKAIEKIRQVT